MAGPSVCGASKGKMCPLKIQYRYRPKEYGDQLVRMYLMTNDEESKLGTHAAAGWRRSCVPRQRA